MDSAKLEKIVNVSSPDAVVVSMAPSKRGVPKSVGQSGSAYLGRGCPVRSTVLGGTLLTLANCLSTTVSITLSTIPVEAPDCHSGVGWPSVDHVTIYPHESGTAPHFLALPW